MSEETAEREASAERKETAPRGAGEGSSAPSPKPHALARWRRVHTLAGGLLLAGFVVVHLLTNASALGGERSYDAVAGSILRLPILPLLETTIVVLPLGFHAGYGLYLMRRNSAGDIEMDRYGDRRLVVVQRISAVFVLLFIAGHVWEIRLQRLLFGLPADAVYTSLTAHLSWTWAGIPWIALFYLFGVFATALHLANGLYAATAAWGILADSAGRMRARVLSVGLGVALFVVGASTVIGLATGMRFSSDEHVVGAPQAPCGSFLVPVQPPFELPLPAGHDRP